MSSEDETPDTAASSVKLERFLGLRLALNTPKGRGVFATQPIPAGTVIEISPVLVLGPHADVALVQKTTLNHYTYNWPLLLHDDGDVNGSDTTSTTSNTTTTTRTGTTKEKTVTTQAVVLGLGSMFNHSRFHQNVGWQRDLQRQVIRYHALRDVGEGEELCISYGDHLTFEDVEARQVDGEDDDENDIYRDGDPAEVLARIGSY